METNKRRKKEVILFDILSLSCGLCGTCLGILSILSLQKFWYSHDAVFGAKDEGATNSLIITCVCLAVDSFSALFALLSFVIGRQQYRLINFKNLDPVGQNLAHHEKISFIMDEISFIISIVGLCFGIISLLTITPWNIETVSIAVTIVAVVLDFVAAMFIVAALEQYREGQDVKSIVKMVKESVGIKTASTVRHNSK